MPFHVRFKPIPVRKRRRPPVRMILGLAALGFATATFVLLNEKRNVELPRPSSHRATNTIHTSPAVAAPESPSERRTSLSARPTASLVPAQSNTAGSFSSLLPTSNAAPSGYDSVARPARDVYEAQLALARLGISPGSIDGVFGSRTQSALQAFQQARGLSATGQLDAATANRLMLTEPLYTNYVVTAEDLARLRPLGKTWLAKSQQDRLDYETVLELVAEASHSSPGLIQRLNPAITWTNVAAGTVVQIPDLSPPPVRDRAAFARIQLERRSLQVFDERTNLLAHFPCSIAAFAEKRPVGELRVAVAARNPNYTFDPENFPESTEARQLNRKLVLQPGPNNPVGTVWVGLDRPGYGIHGTPRPEQVGRAESHGCFRLTNWNAEHFMQLAWVGMPVYVEP